MHQSAPSERDGNESGPGLAGVLDRYPGKLSAYAASLIQRRDDPIGRQFLPTLEELDDSSGWVDPLAEEALSPVRSLVHRYPNRALWLVSHECAAHCRFCTRKRRWKDARPLSEGDFEAGLAYLARSPGIRDVLLSGGDPLLLPLDRLERIISSLRAIPHLEVIRIGSRAPGVLPGAVTPELASMLKKYHPIFMNLHFNHPREITTASRQACALLADAGIPLGSQTVLLRGVNDDAAILGALFHGLLTMRVRPYYLMQMDLTAGTAHFRTPISAGLRILQSLRNHISGIAMPQFVIDLPGGHGKVPLVPNSIRAIHEDRAEIVSYTGVQCDYPLLEGEHEELRRLHFG
ncbi:MAG: KamA family radical SAM protein [Syntrophobacteraceae bacterium]|jgi:lysine 2,3-aminomutase|nr:KamA family radical SAM protein [Syntrophobacteraceae bacterium]